MKEYNLTVYAHKELKLWFESVRGKMVCITYKEREIIGFLWERYTVEQITEALALFKEMKKERAVQLKERKIELYLMGILINLLNREYINDLE